VSSIRTKNSDSVVPLPSATVVVARQGESDPEILMVRRRAGDVFGDSYTFPGGIVDDDESAAHAFCEGRTAAQANQVLQLPNGGLDYYSAAIRELFEETGVLLAREAHGGWAFSRHADAASLLRKLRGQLNERVVSWAEVLQQHKLRIACDALHYFSFWETPLRLPKRWAARFFLAETPPAQDAQHDGDELTDSCWMTAAEVLTVGKERGMKIPFPTLTNLRKLSEFGSLDELLCWSAAQAAAGVDKIRPVALQESGKPRFVIPGDPDYPEGGDS